MPATATKEKKTCFVITPIGDNNSDIRRHIDGIIDQAIEPALGTKYEIVVAHRKYEIGSINDRVIKSVYDADLVIANLTNTNPNVMFELAIRYSFGKPAIVIAEDGTKLPFDVIDENTIFYRNDPTGANELRQKLIEFEKAIISEDKKFGPVYKVIKTIPLYDEVESGKDVSQDKVLQYVIDRLDSLEKNLNAKLQKRVEKVFESDSMRRVYIKFVKNENFDKNEIEEIENLFAVHSMRVASHVNGSCLNVDCILNEYRYPALICDLENWTELKGNIKYYVEI